MTATRRLQESAWSWTSLLRTPRWGRRRCSRPAPGIRLLPWMPLWPGRWAAGLAAPSGAGPSMRVTPGEGDAEVGLEPMSSSRSTWAHPLSPDRTAMAIAVPTTVSTTAPLTERG